MSGPPWWIRAWRTLTTLLLIAVVIGSVWRLVHGADLRPAPAASAAAPSFALRDLSGQSRTLEDFRGRAVLLNFWATWCPACRAELPELEELSRTQRDCLTLVGLVQSSGSADEVRAFVDRHQLSYPMLLDDGQVGTSYGVEAIPRSVLVSPDGRLLGTFDGPVSGEGVRSALRAAGLSC